MPGLQAYSLMQAQVGGALPQLSGIGTQTVSLLKPSLVTQVCPTAVHWAQSCTKAHCSKGTHGPQQPWTTEGTRPASQLGGSAGQVAWPEQSKAAMHSPALQRGAVTPSSVH
jgi:hypothetical protein